MKQNNIKGSAIRLSTVATSTRRTAKTDFGTVMRNGLVKGAGVVSKGLQVAAPFIPGSAIVSAAVAGTNLAASFASSGGSKGQSASYGTAVSGLSAPGTGSIGGGGQTTGVGLIPGAANPLQQSGGSAGASPSDAFTNMQDKVRETAEFQASFNLQYLDLQQTIQQDTRQFNLISNIMKTKHDAAKNALNNVR